MFLKLIMTEKEKLGSAEIYKVAGKYGQAGVELVDKKVGKEMSFSDLFSTIENLELALLCFFQTDKKFQNNFVNRCVEIEDEDGVVVFLNGVSKILSEKKASKSPEQHVEEFGNRISGVVPPEEIVIRHKIEFGEGSGKEKNPRTKEERLWERVKKNWTQLQKEFKKDKSGCLNFLSLSSVLVDIGGPSWDVIEKKVGMTEKEYFEAFKTMVEFAVKDSEHRSWIENGGVVATQLLFSAEYKKEVEKMIEAHGEK